LASQTRAQEQDEDAQNAVDPEALFVPNEILVRLREQPATLPAFRARQRVRGRTVRSFPEIRVEVWRVAPELTVRRAAEELSRAEFAGAIEYAEPNWIFQAHDIPNDAQFGSLWGMHNAGQTGGTIDADIDAPEAWDVQTGSSAVVIAVIDSGVDYTHPDLAANYAGGSDFVSFDGDPMDDHGHGTHVAGTIAAAMNNLTGTPAEAEGVAGVAPNARLLAYKVCRADGTCDDFAIQQAIARAIADGANVINMSLGQSAYSQSLDDAVQDAWNAGLVIVAGAGNDGVTAPFYPAAFDNVISVAAFDADHRRASFSNYGSWVDVSAPGDIIMSTYPISTCGGSTIPGDTGCYAWLSGTSMATPHVSGAAALVWSRSDVTSNSQVVEILLQSADRQGVGGVPLDSWTVHGGLNLHDAVTYSTTNPMARAGADQTVMDADEDGFETVTLDGSAKPPD
jgi:thermitase